MPLTLTIPGYVVMEIIHKADNTTVCRAKSQKNEQPVVLKVINAELSTLEQINRLKREFETTENLNLHGVVKVYGLETHQNLLVLVAEDFGGVSLKDFLFEKKGNKKKKKGALATDVFLNIAIQIVQALASLHSHNIIHKDIKPSNIIINRQTQEVKITDFSIASRLSQDTQLANSNQLEGTLVYMSPEQTGRINRCIDHRTDFYSLGVTFYEILTGSLPFDSNDPLEIVYGHIAKEAVPIERFNSKVPKAIISIVTKLMSKNVEERYQSANALLRDLQQCLVEYQETGAITNFIPGECDYISQFRIPQKLYGREEEINQLLKIFEQVSQGSCELVEVTGFLGIGKSMLVNETLRKLADKKCYFLSGKFDQSQRNIPLFTISQALRGLILKILIESRESLEIWRQKLLEVLGANAQVIIDNIPELELLIGKQTNVNVKEIDTKGQLNYYIHTFTQLIQIFASSNHPLIIFMDDMQWADTASLQILQSLLTNPNNHYILIIASYRDLEIYPTHPLLQTIKAVKKAKIFNVTVIKLEPLNINHVNEIVAETLNCPKQDITILGKALFNKTQGHPFFLIKLINSLHTSRLLNFDYNQNQWLWDIEEIQKQNITDNVVELMVYKLQNLPESTQKLLQIAACIGHEFDLQTLAQVSTITPQETMQELWGVLQQGLIIPMNNDYKLFIETDSQELIASILEQENFGETLLKKFPSKSIFEKDKTISYLAKTDNLANQLIDYLPNDKADTNNQPNFQFLHERIQQAFYKLISEIDRQKIHLKIGQILRQKISDGELESQIFEIVNHFNRSFELALKFENKIEIAQMNLIAGNKAKAIAAYDKAFEYLNTGISILDKKTWQSNYQLALELHQSAIEAAYLCGDFVMMEELAAKVIENAKTPLNTIKVYETIIQSLTVQNKPLEAIKIARQALEQFNISFPEQPAQSDVEQYLQATATKLSKTNIQELANNVMMEDPKCLGIMEILSSVIPASYISAPKLAALITLKQIELLVEYGNAPISPFCYASYGLLLNSIQQYIQTASQFGTLALKLSSTCSSASIKAMTYYIVAAFINHGKTHIKESLTLFQSGYQLALEADNIEFVGYCLREICHFSYLIGEELSTIEQNIQEYSQVLSKLKQERTYYSLQTLWQSLLNWQGKSNNPCLLNGEACDEETLLTKLIQANELEGLFHFYLRKLILCYCFEDINLSSKLAVKTRQYLAGGMSFCSVPVFYFYDSLTVLATSSKNFSDLQRVSQNQGTLQKWAYHAPMNYQHKYDLVEAERYRILGQKYQAMEYYDRAISGAIENGYIQESALANELAGKFYLAQNQTKIAQAYMWEAYNSYVRWGAVAKVKQLESLYPRIFQRETIKQKETGYQITLTSTKGSTNTSKEVLDLATIMKASQAIASEIVLDKLLQKLLHIIIENASAQKGCIILERDQQLFIEVADNSNDISEAVLQSTLVDESVDIPVSVIYYVERTKTSLVLNDASQEGIFQTDPYILQKQPHSVLCTPIFHQGKFIGIVYLENNLSTGAFTKERLKIIQVLTSQAAIAIENARLYAQEQLKTQQLSESLALIAQKEEQYRSIFENVSDGLGICDVETGRFVSVNSAVCNMYGYSKEEWPHVEATQYVAPKDMHLFADFIDKVKSGKLFTCEASVFRKDGTAFNVDVKATGLMFNGKLHALSITRDISERLKSEKALQERTQQLEQTLEKLQRTQSQLVQTEKISQLGQLVAGVAHEVNNPVSFINGNLTHSKQYVEDLIHLLNLYQQKCPNPGSEIEAEIEAIDLDFLLEDLPKMLSSMKLGTDRIRDIMQSLRNFSRSDSSEKRPIDIHESIDTTLIVLSHRLKVKPERPAIQIIKEYGNIPLLKCFPGQLNQVFMNLLANAIDALDESNTGKSYFDIEKNPNIIKISTFVQESQLTIKITDNGKGMSEEVRKKLFEAFFTTKVEGKGTGLGLSISYQIVTEVHGGTLECISSPGLGAEFVIKLPL